MAKSTRLHVLGILISCGHHCLRLSPQTQGNGLQGGESTELFAASPSSAQEPGCCCLMPWVGTGKGKWGSSTMSRAGLPSSPQINDEPAPHHILTALHHMPSTHSGQGKGCNLAGPGRKEEEEQLCEPQPGMPSPQPPCSKFVRPQSYPKSWISLEWHQLLPPSCSSPSLQHSETGSELPPGRKRRQRRHKNSSKQHGAASTPPAAPGAIPRSSGGSPLEPSKPASPQGQDPRGDRQRYFDSRFYWPWRLCHSRSHR